MDALKELDKTLELYLGKKAPSLPKNIKELFVKLAPWISVVAIILGLPALLAVWGISWYVSMPMRHLGYYRLGPMYYISVAFLGITLLLRVLAVPGLFSRSLKAWNLLYYSVFLNLIYSLLSYSVVGGIVGAIVSLYFLYQVKSYYK